MAKTYATLDPSNTSALITLSGGNLVATKTTTNSFAGSRATLGVSSGKWYWELVITHSSNSIYVGVGTADCLLGQQVGYYATGYSYAGFNGNKSNNSSSSAYGNSWTTGAVIGIALDMDNGQVWFSKNGTWQASGDPANGANAAFTGLSGSFYPFISLYNNSPADVLTANFGASTLSYTPPQGFKSGLYTGGYEILGTILDSAGDPAERSVFAYVESSGSLAGSTTSSAEDGSYIVGVDTSADHFVVTLGESGKNALILRGITPVDG